MKIKRARGRIPFAIEAASAKTTPYNRSMRIVGMCE
jgi:hypothetical protein